MAEENVDGNLKLFGVEDLCGAIGMGITFVDRKHVYQPGSHCLALELCGVKAVEMAGKRLRELDAVGLDTDFVEACYETVKVRSLVPGLFD